MNADCAAVAARLQSGTARFCVTPDGVTANAIKRCGNGHLPPIVSLPRLLAAAAVLPIDAELVSSAIFWEQPADDSRWVWRVYDALGAHCGSGYAGAARLNLAQKLVRLFREVDARLVIEAGQNPFAALAETGSYEGAVAAAVWDVLMDTEEEAFGTQPLLAQLERVLPPFVAVADETTPPPLLAFYERCGAEVFLLEAAEAVREWEGAFAVTGAPLRECRHRAAAGAGDTLTQTAQLALDYIADFAAAGEQDEERRLGIVVYDRLLARRLRALAEARKVQIADASGWRAESLAYGAALALYVSAVVDGFNLPRLGELLFPPFFAEQSELAAAAAASWSDVLGGALDLPTTMEELMASAERCDFHPALVDILAGVQTARAQAEKMKQPPAVWLEWLLESAAPALAAWREDVVAWLLCERLRQRAAAVPVLFTAADFLLWLRERLATEYIGDNFTNSPVQFVEPGAGAGGGGAFSAVLLLGFAGKVVSDDAGWLGEREREILALPLRAERFADARRQFCRLLAANEAVAAVWCKTDDGGRPQGAHPFWSLFADHCRAHGCYEVLLPRDEMEEITAGESESLPLPLPAPTAPVAVLPPFLHISAADQLMTCPYLFYGFNILALADEEVPVLDRVTPLLAGGLMHQVLEAFSRESADLPVVAARACLHRVLRRQLKGNRPGLSLLLLHWLRHGDEFIEWERACREAGWCTHETECTVSVELTLPSGTAVEVRGRVDRIDEKNGALAVLDYKSGKVPTKKELAAGEMPQVLLYGYIAAQTARQPLVSAGLCRPLFRGWSAVFHEEDAPRRVAARLRAVLRQIDSGVPLPANGCYSSVCQKCSMAGVCRREEWQK